MPLMFHINVPVSSKLAVFFKCFCSVKTASSRCPGLATAGMGGRDSLGLGAPCPASWPPVACGSHLVFMLFDSTKDFMLIRLRCVTTDREQRQALRAAKSWWTRRGPRVSDVRLWVLASDGSRRVTGAISSHSLCRENPLRVLRWRWLHGSTCVIERCGVPHACCAVWDSVFLVSIFTATHSASLCSCNLG